MPERLNVTQQNDTSLAHLVHKQWEIPTDVSTQEEGNTVKEKRRKWDVPLSFFEGRVTVSLEPSEFYQLVKTAPDLPTLPTPAPLVKTSSQHSA